MLAAAANLPGMDVHYLHTKVMRPSLEWDHNVQVIQRALEIAADLREDLARRYVMVQSKAHDKAQAGKPHIKPKGRR